MLMDTLPADAQRRSTVVPIQFWTEYLPDGNGDFQPVDFVKWGRRGDLMYTQNVDKVSRISQTTRPQDGSPAMPNPVWDGIRAAYDAWKSGQETPPDGTPLAAWPGVSSTQARVLREAHYRCVEDVAAITDGELGKVRLPDVRGLRDRARAFLDAKGGQEKMTELLSERDAAIAAMRAELDEAKAALVRLAAPEQRSATTAPAKRA